MIRKQLYLGASLGSECWRIFRQDWSLAKRREELTATAVLSIWPFLCNALRKSPLGILEDASSVRPRCCSAKRWFEGVCGHSTNRNS